MMAAAQASTFRPSPRALAAVLALTLAALSYALYLRYRVVESSVVGLACEAGVASWTCLSRKIAIGFFNNAVFGYVALAAAALNLLRPAVLVFAIGLTAAGFGVVLYNVELSALAISLLVLSLARPAPRAE